METLVKKFKKLTTAELLKKVDKLTGLDLKACVRVLDLRGQDVSKWAEAAGSVVDTESKSEEPSVLDEILEDIDKDAPTATEEPIADEPASTETTDEEQPAEELKSTETAAPAPKSSDCKIVKGDTVTFTSAKNSKKAPNQEFTGVVTSLIESKGKTFLTIKVEGVGKFLKEASKCK